MRGRKPKPTVLVELHGPTSKSRAPRPAEPKPVGNLSDPPSWMSADQQVGWHYALANSPPGLLKRLDRGVLAAWVIAEDLHRQAVIGQNNLGALIVKTPSKEAGAGGFAIQSPFLPIINRQAEMMLRAAGELGFSPCARPRVSAAAEAAPNFNATGDLTAAPAARKPGRAEKAAVPLDEYLASTPARPTVN